MSNSLAGKSVAELKSMIANADTILSRADTKKHPGAAAFRQAAQAALSGRRVSGSARAPDAAMSAAVARLKVVAGEALARFDLSADTAAAQGVRAPHRLLSPNGEPKVGGGVRSGKFSRCPYISYSGRGGIAMLQYSVPKGGAEPFWSGGLTEVGAAAAKTNFDVPMEEGAASDAFLAALADIAPPRA